jgi:hypothetical protein
VKPDETSYTISREYKESELSQLAGQKLPLIHQQHSFSNLENPYIKAAVEKGLTKEQQFREKVEQAKKEFIEMERQTPYAKIEEGLSKEIGEMQPGAARFLKTQIASYPRTFHMFLHGITRPIRMAQIRWKYGEAGKVALEEVTRAEKEVYEEQKKAQQEEFMKKWEEYRADPKKHGKILQR